MTDKKNMQYEALIGDQVFTFSISNERLERFFNELTPSNKFGPFNNLLLSTVQEEQREALRGLIQDDFLLLMKLFEQFSTEMTSKIEVQVKKL